MKKLIDVYPYRIRDGHPEFLLLKRSSAKIYAHQWRMIGGKVNEGEESWKAALRELKEETGLRPKLFWTIPSVNQFYEAKTDTIHSIPAFAAELEAGSRIELDAEHTDYKWIKVDETPVYIVWPEQIRLMRIVFDILTHQHHKILPEWILEDY